VVRTKQGNRGLGQTLTSTCSASYACNQAEEVRTCECRIRIDAVQEASGGVDLREGDMSENDRDKKYMSITRNFRGFNYQTYWRTSEEWEKETKSDKEAEWSVLVPVESGTPVLQYRRGAKITTLNG